MDQSDSGITPLSYDLTNGKLTLFSVTFNVPPTEELRLSISRYIGSTNQGRMPERLVMLCKELLKRYLLIPLYMGDRGLKLNDVQAILLHPQEAVRLFMEGVITPAHFARADVCEDTVILDRVWLPVSPEGDRSDEFTVQIVDQFRYRAAIVNSKGAYLTIIPFT
jgi:hypothetical protein